MIWIAVAALGAMIYHRFFYAGKRRRVPGQHRYREADCVNMLWATVKPAQGSTYSVPIWGYAKLEMGVL